ncbi:MAG TPA: glutamine synthetase III [Oscillospiraceae bacterium]|nr:glutamine synthetase III [Oscillospiraceae bacterium]HPF55225.1 glutamine synthetase III [Clostridiales bacterium]HPR75960.1 glutamine synthetase III [Oscillospiraceae bacterium]
MKPDYSSGGVPELFGSMVFGEDVMRERLPKDIYDSLQRTIQDGRELDITVANAVAAAMKDWALEKGATHFTHWFQPMTGITAEKHDSFISPRKDGKVLMEFSGKELIKGEPDASSFPSGGLRATFEARGYTAWDPTSYAFIKDDSLCIPTAFYSYGGQVLDKKTPLLRSMEALSRQSLRILKLFGMDDVKRVNVTVGPEQEYFLIDKEVWRKRRDLVLTGRTLFGAKSPKGQELEDHYFGVIKPRVMAFMQELNLELWKLGIYAKTEHNEVAPAQHELAPVFCGANNATDHNQLTMELMKKVADRHGMACLLQEKPFDGINGSGKHDNWSLMTGTGINLLDPGKKPQDNKRFLLFLCAVVEAVDKHQDLLRISVASAGNDHRLGANEAPPAIVSMFLGDELTGILEAIECGGIYDKCRPGDMDTGVNVLPNLKKDTTDRNRTSPLAFTGNKFEFRMPGAPQSIADPNTFLNTIVADVLAGYADRLEKAGDFEAEIDKLLNQAVREHKRIIFNGNSYAAEWVVEAEKRGLLNLRTAADAIPRLDDQKNIDLFARHKIFTESELHSRCEIMLDSYCKVLGIEAQTMLELAKRDILPAVNAYTRKLSETAAAKKEIGILAGEDCCVALCNKLSKLANQIYKATEELENAIADAPNGDLKKRAEYSRDRIIPAMTTLRSAADEAETLTDREFWPFPSYGDVLFSV